MAVSSRMPSMLKNYASAVLAGGKRYRPGMPIPALSLQASGVRIDKRHLARYNRVCGFADDATIAPTYLQILAFPLQIGMLAQKAFPIPLLGIVHVRNVIDVLAPLSRDVSFDLAVSVADHRLVAKGVEIDLLTQATVGGNVVWRAVTTMLHRCRTDVPEGEKTAEPAIDANLQYWVLPAGLGRSYGLASGDINPIHLSAFSARAFGFKRAIAHGMWSKARCLAALESVLPKTPYRIEVAFKLPILLPAKVRFSSRRAEEAGETGYVFELRSSDGAKPHMRGMVRPLPAQ
jgi:acyl dehydratase